MWEKFYVPFDKEHIAKYQETVVKRMFGKLTNQPTNQPTN
jgi:hypothetical protein